MIYREVLATAFMAAALMVLLAVIKTALRSSTRHTFEWTSPVFEDDLDLTWV
jgi:hypothetical protein